MTLHTTQVTMYVAENPQDVLALLDKAGTRGPSLHPDVNSENFRHRWNGWNVTLTNGRDADGRVVEIERWHFASGRCDHSVGINDETPHLSTRLDVLDRIAYPVQLFEPLSIIRHPEHTPDSDS